MQDRTAREIHSHEQTLRLQIYENLLMRRCSWQFVLLFLTISVEIEHINNVDEKLGFKKIFNDYIDFDSSENLSEIEEDLNIEIVNNLVEDIFNEAFMNWQNE